jgi:chromosome segregation ATPase
MRHVPERFHRFITPTLRRVYLDTADSSSQREEVDSLRSRLQQLEREVAKRERGTRTLLSAERTARRDAQEQCDQALKSQERAEEAFLQECAARKRIGEKYLAEKNAHGETSRRLKIAIIEMERAEQRADDMDEEIRTLHARYSKEKNEKYGLERRLSQVTNERDSLERAFTDLQARFELLQVAHDKQSLQVSAGSSISSRSSNKG